MVTIVNNTVYLNVAHRVYIYIYIYIFFFFFKDIYLFIYSFVYGCVGSLLLRAGFLSRTEWGLLFLAVLGLLIAVASLVAEHGL